MQFDRLVCVGLKGYDVDTSISMAVAELSDQTADEVREALVKAVEKFDQFRRDWPRSPKPKKFWPHVIDGGSR